MDDLISRQAAIDTIMEEPSEVRYPAFYAEKIRQLSLTQPTANMVEVTQCEFWDSELNICALCRPVSQPKEGGTKNCVTCTHYPPSKKWPCEDCDMRYCDRFEAKEGGAE